MVARIVRDDEAAGSNPVFPTINRLISSGFLFFILHLISYLFKSFTFASRSAKIFGKVVNITAAVIMPAARSAIPSER